jgi:large subunit ribosomal protein L23
MGLLNNWLHKQTKEQLSKAGEKKASTVVVAKSEPAKEKKNSKAHDHAGHDHAGHTHTEKTEKKAEPKMKAATHTLAYKILIKPLVTEKSAIAESKNKYSFVVVKSANKNQIKTAIAEVYGVKPASVNVANMEGRRVRFGKSMGRRNDYKKAIITLPEGKTIDIHSGV